MRNNFFRAATLVLSLAALAGAGLPASAQHHQGGHIEGHAPPHVGSVHFGVRESGGFRMPYRDEYFRRFRPGYFPLVLGGAQYYYYNALPPGCPPVLVNGVTYFLCGGIYYSPYFYGGRTVFLVVPPA